VEGIKNIFIDAVTLILLVLLAVPILIIIIGIAYLFNADVVKRKSGAVMLAIGIGIIGVALLIGNAVCSNFHLGNMN
jgi:pilus assembly protein TadC